MLDLVIADDDDDYRLLTRLAIDGAPDLVVCAEATTADELVDIVTASPPDLVLLDASLPGCLAASARMRLNAPKTRIVLTSSLPAALVAGRVAAAGAAGLLAKDVPVRNIPSAIRELSELATVAERALRVADTTLLRDTASPRESRRLARGALEGWCDPGVVDNVELLISELVTNVVKHAATDVDVRIAIGRTTVRIEVGDRNPAVPVMRTTAADEAGGKGMHIVHELSLRWGVQSRRTGKCVWFEVPRALSESA
jgi:DNA-binding NarL/FixJ family response regulator